MCGHGHNHLKANRGRISVEGEALTLSFALEPWQVRRDVDFGLRATPAGDPSLPPTTLCTVDDFEDATLDAAWTLSALGTADQGDAVLDTGRLELSSNGPELWNADHAHFLHRAVTGDFRVEIDLEEIVVDPGGSEFRKAGLMVRDGLDPQAPRIMIQFLPHTTATADPRLQFGVRTTQGGVGETLADIRYGSFLPMRLAIERRGDQYTVLYSTDGGSTWSQPTGDDYEGTVNLDLGASPEVGVVVASYDDQATLSAAFDDFGLCQPDLTVVPTPASGSCDPAAPLDVVVALDLSGSMTAGFSGASDRLQAVQLALAEVADRLVDRTDGSRLGLVTYGAEGTSSVMGLTAEIDIVQSMIDDLSSSDLSASTATTSVHGLHAAGALLAAGTETGHRPVLLWLADEPPTIDALGRGPYTSETLPPTLVYRDGLGDFLAPGAVAWQGPFLSVNGWWTYAGEPAADLMRQVEALKAAQPELEIWSVALDGDGVLAPPWNIDLLAYAAEHTGAAAASGTDTSTLLSALTDLVDAMECQP